MTKGLNKIKVLLVIALVAFMAFGALTLSANVKTSASENINFKMRQTAELRLIDDSSDSGIRFVVDMDETTKNKIANASEFGFIIAPTVNFDGVNSNYHAIDHVNVAFDQDQRANNIYFDQDSETYRANGVLVGVLDKNYELEFSAVAYYKESAESNYVYADRGNNPVSVSVKELAESIYTDTTMDEIELYEAQQKIRTYIGTGATEQKAIAIETEQDLKMAMSITAPTNYVLRNDITLTEATLGIDKKANIFESFYGRLDGNGNKLIFNINYGKDYIFKGLIGTIEKGASISNLYVKASVDSMHGDQGIIATELKGTIDSCIFDTYIAVAANTSFGTYVNFMRAGAVISNCISINESTEAAHKIIFRNYDDSSATVRNFVYAGNMYSQNAWSTLPESVAGYEEEFTFSNIYRFTDIGSAIAGKGGQLLKDYNLGNNRTQHEWENVTTKLSQIFDSETLKITETEEKLTLTLKDKVIIEQTLIANISTTEQFDEAMRSGAVAKYKLTADITLGTETSPEYTVGASSTKFSAFNGILEGNGHTINMYVSAMDVYGLGVFSAFNGTIRNAKINVVFKSNWHKSYYPQGILAENFNGTLENCIISYNEGIASAAKQGLFASIGADAVIRNCLIDFDGGSSYRLFAYTVDANAVIENIAYIARGGVDFRYPLPNNVAPKIKNVVIYSSIANAENSVAYYKLDNDKYPTSTTPNGSNQWDTVNWLTGGTVAVSSVITGIIVSNGVAQFVE